VKNREPTPENGSPARLTPDAGPSRNTARLLPRGLAAERQAARAEAASLAPWRDAIAVARATRHAALAANRAARQATRTTQTPSTPPARPSPPNPPPNQYSLLQRELAARKAGLGVRISEPHQPPVTGARSPNSTFSRIHPMNPDTTAAPTPKPNSAFPRIHPMNPETTAPSRPTQLTPADAEALRTATLAALPNRAARRRWKSQQRRLHRDPAT
jgi:hypothetical protein